MPDYGITDTGFVLKRTSDIKTDLVARLNVIQDPVTGETLTVDLDDENDPLVLIVNSLSDSLGVCWEQLQLANNQFDPLKATGAGLSGTVQLNKLRRRAGTYSTVSLALTGVPSSSFVAGKQVSTMDDTAVFTLPAVTFDGSGDAVVTGTATEKGIISAVAGSVVKILTPVSGWYTVTNPTDAVEGTEEETDTQLRLRQQSSMSSSGKSVIETLYGNLMQLEGVTFCRVYQNTTLVEDGRGLPAKSIAVVIVGGDDDEIALTIFQHVALGVATFGTTLVSVISQQDFEYPIYFSRPEEVPIYISIEVQVFNDAIWPLDADDLIKAAIIQYALYGAFGLGITSGFDQTGYLPGEAVYASELYTAINTVYGAKIVYVYVGLELDPSDLTDEIAIEWDQIATFASENIEIVIS